MTDSLPRSVSLCRVTTGSRKDLVQMFCLTLIATLHVGNASRLTTQAQQHLLFLLYLRRRGYEWSGLHQGPRSPLYFFFLCPQVTWRATPALVAVWRLRQPARVLQDTRAALAFPAARRQGLEFETSSLHQVHARRCLLVLVRKPFGKPSLLYTGAGTACQATCEPTEGDTGGSERRVSGANTTFLNLTVVYTAGRAKADAMRQ